MRTELREKFTIKNPSPVHTEMEEKIQNRLLNGFDNWNRGYDAWLSWGDILYTESSMYNIHGVRLTLKGYQEAMDATLKENDILMGNFNNMIIVDGWCAIFYEASNVNRKTAERSDYTVMEFVNFKDYKDPLGCRVVEGWAGNKGSNFRAMLYFIKEDKREGQIKFYENLLSYDIPKTDNLEEKYPVIRPTSIKSDIEREIKDLLLADFEAYNMGKESYISFLDENADEDFTYTEGKTTLSLDEYKKEIREGSAKTERLYFNNMIIRENWAGIYYTVRTIDENGSMDAGTRMQFINFKKSDDGLKIKGSWIS